MKWFKADYPEWPKERCTTMHNYNPDPVGEQLAAYEALRERIIREVAEEERAAEEAMRKQSARRYKRR